MYQYKVSNADANKVKKLADNADVEKLLNQIANINKSFANSGDFQVDKNVSFDKLEQVNKSDDDLLKEAENSLYDFKSTSLNKIEEDTASKKKSLVEDINTLKTQAEDTKGSIASYYDNARKAVSDDALKRGLARSSIVINNLDALTDDEINAYTSLDKEIGDKVNALNFEINALDAQKQSALNDFDISYAVKLDTKLAELKQQLADRQMEIVKYNNDIAKAEEDYKLKYANLESELANNAWDKEYDMIKIASEYGSGMLDKYKSNKIYSLVKDYLGQFDSAEAKKILSSNVQLQNALGNRYQTLLNEL